MTNTITILAIVLVGFGVQSAYACAEEDIQHWMNVRIQIELFNFEHATEPSLLKEERFLLPMPTMGPEILSPSNVKTDVADRLNELGYFVDDGGPRPITADDVFSVFLNPDSVGYSTICKDGIQQMIGGMLLQPDATAIFLAYGIANAIWLAPLAGIAAGVYLTRNKWKR